MRVICISGKAGAGKDTAAQLMACELTQRGKKVLTIHLADLLKHICKRCFNWNGVKDEKGRTLLQYIGTDIIRKHNPDYWVNFVVDVLTMFPGEWDYVFIPDCRFPNEVERLKEHEDLWNVTTLNITGNITKSELTSEQREHPSETALDGFKFDYEIANNGTIWELKEELIKLPDKLEGKSRFTWADLRPQ